MAKAGRKGKGASKGAEDVQFDADSLSQLAAEINKNLKPVPAPTADNKRKTPPTKAPRKDAKRQRPSNETTKPKGHSYDQAALLEEIKALGGDEKDLDLINGVESGSEDEGYAEDSNLPLDKKLKAEILALSTELGLAKHAPMEASEDEDQEEPQVDEVDEEGQDVEEDDTFEDDQKPTKPGSMLFEPRADWHVAKLRPLPVPKTDQLDPFTRAIEPLKRHAQTLLDDDTAKYRTSFFASSSHKFLSTIMSSGTLTDKTSALTLAVQESPLHNIRAFDALMASAAKKSRAQAIGAIGALVDLLGPGTILPPNRRLRTFQTQPGLLGTLQQTNTMSWGPGQPLPGKISEMHLISWIYEDWLKDTFFKLIQFLEVWCSDEIEYSRTRSLDFVYTLLKEKPEQEANLLRLLVNKLGDRERKISSRASYLLLQLQNSHPGMKPIIIGMVEQQILLHPSQDHRSKYTAITTLNQTILSSKEPTVAENLVRIYFDLFVTLLKAGSLGISTEFGASDKAPEKAPEDDPEAAPEGGKKRYRRTRNPPVSKAAEPETESADKLISAILTGVNRAAPFIGANEAIMEEHLDTLFKIAHSANFNTSIQALLLIQHLSQSKSMATGRFYRVLYESLLDPRLVTSSKQALYLNLLLRSLKNDVDVRRVKAFAKRMLQTSSLHQPPFVCGMLYVISHLRETFPDLMTLINEPEESAFDDDAERPAYDGRKRDPEYSNANRSCLWELLPVQAHYHPSVTLLANSLLDKTKKMPKPDMESHSLIRFLDKFVYRNAKSSDSSRGVSIMQPLRASKDVGDIWLGGTKGAGAITSLNSAAFWNKKAADVPAQDAFFHEYFQHVVKDPKKAKAKKPVADDSDEEAGENEVWKALVASQPDVDADDADEGFDDLDEADMASDGDSPAMSLDSDMDSDSDGGAEVEYHSDSGSDGLVAVDAEASPDEEEEMDPAKKASKERNEARKAHKKKIRALPTFASTDDYAELLGQDSDIDI